MKENELFEIINNIPQMIWKIDINNENKILFSNKSWNNYTGNINNIFDKNIIHPDDNITTLTSLDKVFSVKRRIKGINGFYRWFLTRAIEGESGIWFGTCTDIEDVVIAENVRIELEKDVANDKKIAFKTREIEREIGETIRLTLFDKANLLSNERDESERIRISLAKTVERDKKTAEKIKMALIEKAKSLENEKDNAEKTRILLAEGAKVLANDVVEKELEKEVAEKVRLILYEKAKVLASEKSIADDKRIKLAKDVTQERGIAEKTRIELSKYAEILANKALDDESKKEIADEKRIELSKYAEVLANKALDADEKRIELSKYAEVLANKALDAESKKEIADEKRIELSKYAKVLANKALDADEKRIELSKYAEILATKALDDESKKEIADEKRIKLAKDVNQERKIAEETRIELSKYAEVLANKALDDDEKRIELSKYAKVLANKALDDDEKRIELSKYAEVLATKALDDESKKEIADEKRIKLAKDVNQERKIAEKTRIELSKYAEVLANKALDDEFEKEIAEKVRIQLEKYAEVLANKALEKEFEKEVAEKVRIKLSEYAEVLAVKVLKKDVEQNIAEHTRIVLSNHAKVLAGEVLITNELLHQMQLDKLLANESHQLQNKANIDTMAEMSHEIRNPLNGVIGLVDLLSDSDLKPDIREYVNSLKEASVMLLNVVTDVLDISKLESGKLEVECIQYKPSDILKDMFMVYLSITHSKGITLINETEYDMTINGDPNKVKQILNNLISNAIKFTSKGTITIRVNIHDGFIFYRIIDTGIGITDEHLKKLFKPYTQADASISRLYGGSGLGLSICKKLVTLMNGEIGANSIAGSGSTFWVKIPLV